MIETVCYSPKPQSHYRLKANKPSALSHMSFGLGDPDFITDEVLWNYCVVTSRLPFLWEDKKIKMKKRPTVFSNLELAKRDMDKFIGGTKVEHHMTMPPEKFMDAVTNENVSHLELCKFFGSEKVFRSIVSARVFVWMKSQNKPLHPNQEAMIIMVRRGI